MQSEIYHIILGAEITTTLANEQFKKVQMELDEVTDEYYGHVGDIVEGLEAYLLCRKDYFS